MQIADILSCLESLAPLAYQESYDNAGLLAGNRDWVCTGAMIALDVTPTVMQEAMDSGCNLVIAHHPVIFSGLKKITGQTLVEKTLIQAIKHDIAIYAIHTNLDNVLRGVNDKIADQLQLADRKILSPHQGSLMKLFTFVPESYSNPVRDALFESGAGQIGDYSEASFNSEGVGTYKAGQGATPFLGKKGERHNEKEIKIEVILPSHLKTQVVEALIRSHPYEEVAYDLVELANLSQTRGAGLVGNLSRPESEMTFLARLKQAFKVPVIRHSRLLGREVSRVAICGGAGSFLIYKALQEGAHIFVTADVKYHDFFNAEDKMVIADIGHHESEQYTRELLEEVLKEKFPTFAVLKSGTITNPVNYYL